MKVKDLFPLFTAGDKENANFFVHLPDIPDEPHGEFASIGYEGLWSEPLVVAAIGDLEVERIDCNEGYPRIYLNYTINYGG